MVTKPKLYESGRPWCRVRLKRLQLNTGSPPCTGGPLMAEAVNAAARRKSDTCNKDSHPGQEGSVSSDTSPSPSPTAATAPGHFISRGGKRAQGNAHRQQFLSGAEASPAMQQPVLKGSSKAQALTCPLTLALARLKEPVHLPSGHLSLVLWGCSRQMRGSGLSSAAC